MTLVPLLGGAYQGRSVIAAKNYTINLYPESAPKDGQPPVPVTHYLTPGLEKVSASPTVENARTLYRATNGELFAVVGATVYFVSETMVWTPLGAVPDFTTPMVFSDNGLVIVLVDGTALSYAIDMTDHTFGQISTTNFYGARSVTQIDTFFIFNRTGTAQFYISLSNVTYAMLIAGTAFDPLDIAAKTGSADPIQMVASVHGELWLIGTLTCEIWANTGAADFAFQRIQGAFIDHGCAAPYSVAQQDISLFWLSQDRQGKGIVVRTNGYTVQQISPRGIEADIQNYTNIADAFGYCHQIDGHAFYVITFPSADVTWAYDLATGQWHRRASIDSNGILHRNRANCYAFAYGQNLVGDYQNGNLYAIDPDVFTDNGTRIPRIKSFPHTVANGSRVFHYMFIAKMEVGTRTGTLDTQPEMVSLRWSDDGGQTWGNAVQQSMGSSGQYLISPQWQRLGMSRDRIYELSWDAPCKTALNGGFLDARKGIS